MGEQPPTAAPQRPKRSLTPEVPPKAKTVKSALMSASSGGIDKPQATPMMAMMNVEPPSQAERNGGQAVQSSDVLLVRAALSYAIDKFSG